MRGGEARNPRAMRAGGVAHGGGSRHFRGSGGRRAAPQHSSAAETPYRRAEMGTATWKDQESQGLDAVEFSARKRFGKPRLRNSWELPGK